MPTPMLPAPLRGIVPPLVTPLLDEHTLSDEHLSKIIENMVQSDISALFALGTTGEGPALNYQLRREVLAATCQIVRKRIPVLAAITDTSLDESLAMGHWAEKCGADAVVVAAPYYFAVSQNDLYRMVQVLSSQLSLPLFLYNMPSLTKASFAPDTVLRCSQLPHVAGIKDSSGDIKYLRTVMDKVSDRKDFTVLVGPEELLSQAMAFGVHGGVHGGANLFPRLFVRLYNALRTKDAPLAATLQAEVLALGKLLYHIGEKESSYLRGLKLGMELLGLCPSFMAAPFEAAHAKDFAPLFEKLEKFARF